jgi:DnaK suppressor protein
MTDSTIRKPGLKDLLREQQRAIHDEVRDRIRHGRTERAIDGGDDQEQSDADSQGDIDYSLLQLKAQTLARIEEALVRLDRGQHGVCRSCGHKIAEQRLRALPFAVRCRACEAAREAEEQRVRKAGQAPTAAIFPGASRP